jgi:rubrerythrin
MTIENAIKWLYAIKNILKDENACYIAINALEKQRAKLPSISGDGYADGKLVYDTWECPSCGKEYEIDYDNYDYCPSCGQHIDRSEIERSLG